MEKILSLIVVLFAVSTFAQEGCDTTKMNRVHGTWSWSEEPDAEGTVASGTEAHLTCEQNHVRFSKDTKDPEVPAVCTDGLWRPRIFCFRPCTNNRLRRIKGTWEFDPEPEDDGVFLHGTKAELSCPEGFYQAERDREMVRKETHGPVVCRNGVWEPSDRYCWPDHFPNAKELKELTRKPSKETPPTVKPPVTTTNSGCKDNDEFCSFWTGYCKTDQWVIENCCHTCATLPTECVDLYEGCWTWKDSCHGRFIGQACRKTCGRC